MSLQGSNERLRAPFRTKDAAAFDRLTPWFCEWATGGLHGTHFGTRR